MKTTLLTLLTISALVACSPKSGNVWLKKEVSPLFESAPDTVEMRFKRYGNAFAVRRPYVLYELSKGHARVAENGWKAVMFVQDPWPERIKFTRSVYFKEITVYEDRYSTVYVVEYRNRDNEYGTNMSIHVVTENGCTIYIAK